MTDIDSVGVSPEEQGKKKCPPHTWEIRDPENTESPERKKKKFRDSAARKRKKGDKHGANADAFSATAADHNKIEKDSDGNCMSGPNEKSRLYSYCKECEERGNEVDQVTRDDDGNITSIVEVKSGNCNITGAQTKQHKEIADQLGVPLKFKLQKGEGANKAKDFLLDKGYDPSAIIIF